MEITESIHRKSVSFTVNLPVCTYGLSDRFCLLERWSPVAAV